MSTTTKPETNGVDESEILKRGVQMERKRQPEIKAIADNATNEDYNVARLKIDSRKWRASKLAPKVYGERQEVDLTGKMQISGVEMTFVRPKVDPADG
jgi:hypothetical protein